MPRSASADGYVNHISVEELKSVLGPHFETAIRQGFSEFFAQLGLAAAEALMQGEVEELCGPKYRRNNKRSAVRWGAQPGTLTLRGTKERISKPRVRSADGQSEIDLETYAALNADSTLIDKAIGLAGAGVSTRQYTTVMEKGLRKAGVSKSAVSRRVIIATKNALEIFLQRRLDRHKLVALLIDGVRIGPVQVVVAVGIDKSGRKHVLGWNRGPSENFIVCRDLIRQLVDRGLDANAPYLFVVDGSKALTQAIRNTFGEQAQVQRCQEHKIRDVEGYLSPRDAKIFRIKLQAAYNDTSYTRAADRLQKIRRELQNISEKATNALTEGMEATLTLHRLGIAGGVRESLRTTNIIESTFARLRYSTRNINNWSEADQVERWLAFTLLKAESGYRRVPGYRQLARLQRQVAAAQTALQTS